MESPDEIIAQLRRDSVSNSQISDQTFVIKKVKGRDITLKFVKNSFRRHFALPSKKKTPTDPLTKAQNKADKRFMAGTGSRGGGPALNVKLTDPAFTQKYGTTATAARKGLLERYSSRSDETTVVDLSSGVDMLMTEMALILVAKTTDADWKVDTMKPVEFAFSKECVVVVTCARDANKPEVIAHAHKRTSKLTAEVVRSAENVFIFDHFPGG